LRILVIDDEQALRHSLTLILRDAGYQVLEAASGSEGLRMLREVRPDMVLCDIRMPGMGGLEFLAEATAGGTDALILMMTAYGGIETAIEAMKAGAYDYLPKPFGADEVLLTIKKAEEREQLRREVGRLREEVRSDRRFGDIVARSPAMIRALELATRVAPHPSPVLITGASGTGKELVARLVHRESTRGKGPFVAVNCGAIPENLLESEFFGYVKGAFSGADRDREGLFEAADGGTLLLDEVGELPATLQVKLLRALQEGEIRRLGGTGTRSVDVRVVSATNRDLEEAIREGEFREDLFYRLAVVSIDLPPLRHRPEEIPLLLQHFIERGRERLGIEVDGIDADALELLTEYPWPGNIRELENVVERALILADGPRLTVEHLPAQIRTPDPTRRQLVLPDDDLSVKRHSAELERILIQRALERTGGHRANAAEALELSERALRYKIKEYGLE
jgi:two-component system, NtrC family, response regulator AtoC